MQRSIYLWLFILFFIAGCGADGTEGIPDIPANPDTPTLSPIGDKTVSAGDQLSFTVAATDPNDLTLTYARDGSVGVGLDPFVDTGNPGTLDTASGQFSWNSMGVMPGDYFAEFSVMNTTGLSDKETIKITVQSQFMVSEALYNASCARSGCHGAAGVAGPGVPVIQCVDSMRYSQKIDGSTIPSGSMAIYVSTWSTADKTMVLNYLQNVIVCP